jgi:hypothetical protein
MRTHQHTLNTQHRDKLEDKLWNKVLGQLQLPKDSFATFLADTTLQSVEDGWRAEA